MHTCENITFSQLRWRAVIIIKITTFLSSGALTFGISCLPVCAAYSGMSQEALRPAIYGMKREMGKKINEKKQTFRPDIQTQKAKTLNLPCLLINAG